MFEMLLGHLVGDYLLQNNWMAQGKSKHSGLGWLQCMVHCVLYSLAVCLFTMFSWKWFCLVFISHFFIDKFSLAEKYLKFVNGRSIEQFLSSEDNKKYTPHVGLRAGITSLVYVVTDNTMHLLLMWGAWQVFYA